MELQKLNVKFFVAEGGEVPLTAFIDVFHSWIQASDGIYYDVADYSHVTAGPGVILIAHEANVGIDETGGRRGLLYSLKQSLEGANRDKLRRVFKTALDNCLRLEGEAALKGKIKFRGDEALFLINDRLVAPNTAETFQDLKPDLEELARSMYGGADFVLLPDTQDPRRRFSVGIKCARPFDVATLLGNLGQKASNIEQRNIN
jgi:hypothetical protein